MDASTHSRVGLNNPCTLYFRLRPSRTLNLTDIAPPSMSLSPSLLLSLSLSHSSRCCNPGCPYVYPFKLPPATTSISSSQSTSAEYSTPDRILSHSIPPFCNPPCRRLSRVLYSEETNRLFNPPLPSAISNLYPLISPPPPTSTSPEPLLRPSPVFDIPPAAIAHHEYNTMATVLIAC